MDTLSMKSEETPTLSALVVIPGNINHFYNLTGQRLAESLRAIGFHVDVTVLREVPEREYDWCVLVNINEVIISYDDFAGAVQAIHALHSRCNQVAAVALDSVKTPWYAQIQHLCDETRVETILDLGLFDQTPLLEPQWADRYQSILAGLTPTELEGLDALLQEKTSEREIPWAFLGHYTPQRASLVDYFVEEIDAAGFVYMPDLEMFKEEDSPHLNQRQMESVLWRTRYQIWCSHHDYFYMEPERFRTSLVTGSVPIKVVKRTDNVPHDAPFRAFVMKLEDLPGRLRPELFEQCRSVFLQEVQRIPSLPVGLGDYLVDAGVVQRDRLLPFPQPKHEGIVRRKVG